jgi:hypothetical protein
MADAKKPSTEALQAAMEWADAHPNDPRTPAIRAKLESFGFRAGEVPFDGAEHLENQEHTGVQTALHYLAKAAPPVGAALGGTAGSALGLPAGPASVAVGAAGAGLGATAGRALQIKTDQLTGYPAPDLLDPKTLHSMAIEGGINAAFQAIPGALGLGAGAIGKGMDPGRVRNMMLGFSKYTGAMSPAEAIAAKGTMLEPLAPELMDELITSSVGGKAAVPAAAAVSKRLGARIPLGLEAENVGPNLPALKQSLSGTVPEQAARASDLKDAVRAAIAKDALKQGPAAGAGTNPGSAAAAQKLVTPEKVQAGFENTAGYAPTASDPDALAAAGRVKDLAAQVGTGWGTVNRGRQTMVDAAANGARGVEDATQAGVLDAFVNANTHRGLERAAGHETMSAAALLGNRVRHALAESNPWHQSGAVPRAADAARSLEVEAGQRGLPAVDPALRERLDVPNNPGLSRALEQAALEQWLYGDRDQPQK